MRAGGRAVAARTFTHTLRVRYSECDPQAVVFNANYVSFFDVVMTELWREAIGPYQELVDAGADMVVAELGVRFLGPAGFDDEIAFDARLTRLGETAIVTRIAGRVGDRPVVEGDMRHVFIDVETKRKRAIPANVRNALTAYLHDTG